MNKYYSMVQQDNVATINIYGDITSWPWSDADVSAFNLSRQLDSLVDVNEIRVYINSYGGEVAEGLAIYNALKRHNAKVKTYCDGFACSIASVIFMAGEERIMADSSLLMIHNAWTCAQGNAAELRKQADDLEKITQASVNAYLANSTLTEEEIVKLMDAESWILPNEAVEYGFATSIQTNEAEHASQSARNSLVDIVKMHRSKVEESAEDESEESEEPETEEPENPGDEPEDEPADDGEEETEEEKAAQRWSGFFNALIKD